MPDLSLRFNKDMLVVAPLFSLALLDENLDGSESLEYFNILDEDLVRETHLRYRAAGARCVLTNTLRAHRLGLEASGLEEALEDINRAGVSIARACGFEHVIAAVEVSDEEALAEQASALLLEDPDAFFLQGTPGSPELTQAVATLKAMTSLPIFAPSSAFADEEKADVLCLSGLSLAQSIQALQEREQGLSQLQGDASGAEATSGEDDALEKDALKPLMVCPFPGELTGSNEWQRKQALNQLADEVADFALEVRRLGVQFISTSAGSSPALTGAISATVDGLDVLI